MLKEALEVDGFEVPPRSAEDRLKELRAPDPCSMIGGASTGIIAG
jgi:hypothetical protein